MREQLTPTDRSFLAYTLREGNGGSTRILCKGRLTSFVIFSQAYKAFAREREVEDCKRF